MSKFTEFQDEQPIISAVPITSKSKSDDAMANVMGDMSKELFAKAQTMEQEQSATMYYQTRGMMEKAKTDASVQMIQNPGNAAQIAKNATESMQYMAKNAVVNKQNRNQLNYDAQTIEDGVTEDAAQKEYEQTRLMGKFNILTTLNPTFDAYSSALQKGDEKGADNIQNNMLSTLRGAVSSRTLTPMEAFNIMDHMHQTLDAHKQYVDLLNDPDANAKDINSAYVQMPSSSPLGTANLPADQNTNYLHQGMVQDAKTQGVLNALVNRYMPNEADYTAMSPKDQAKVALTKNGIAQALGTINSNQPYQQIQARMDEINNSINPSTADIAENKMYKKFDSQLKNGDYIPAISDTVNGAQITQGYVATNNAIQSSALDPQVKSQYQQKNYNDMVTSTALLGKSMHLPDKLINPIPKQAIDTTQGAFANGADPSMALQVSDYHSDVNKVYLAGSMKTPLQQEVMESVGYISPKDDDGFRSHLIIANQTGHDFSNLTLGKTADSIESSSEALKVGIASDPTIKQILSYKLMFANGGESAPAFSNAALNYIKYQAQLNNDPTISHYQQYLSDFSSHMQKAYNILQTPNAQINENVAQLTKAQLSQVSSYALDKAQIYLGKNKTSDQLNREMDGMPLMVSITPDHNLVVNTTEGRRVYSEPWTGETISAAKQHIANKLNPLLTQGDMSQQQKVPGTG